MLGTMMAVPMLTSRLIDHACVHHGAAPVVGREINGSVRRKTWSEIGVAARRLASAMVHLGYGAGDVVGTLAWNTTDHLEALYALTGIGTAVHTLNPRLAVDDLAYMIDLVGESTIFFDSATCELAERLAKEAPSVTRWIYMGDGEGAAHLRCVSSMTKLVETHAELEAWPVFDENLAATICFTSGTTGRPKGVAYSHRSITLGAMNMSMAEMYATAVPGRREIVMPISAIFHANAWMMPFTAPMNGHGLVLPGRAFDAPNLLDLIDSEGVTLIGAVPTVWQDLLDCADARPGSLTTVKTALLSGSRPSPVLAQRFEQRGMALRQSWGMTEAPGATRGSPLLDGDGIASVRLQGRTGFQIAMRLVGDDGADVPFDGSSPGRLLIRGPTIAGGYIGHDQASLADWLDTGDIATIGPGGGLEIVDRSKDVIKSGGEWISSLRLEQAAMTHPSVALAAAIGMPHPRWEERPLLLCVLKPDTELTTDQLLAHMRDLIVKWWLPDVVEVVDAMPLTTTGKVDKVALRRRYADRRVRSGQAAP